MQTSTPPRSVIPNVSYMVDKRMNDVGQTKIKDGVCMRIHIYIYIYIYMHIYINTKIHVCIYTYRKKDVRYNKIQTNLKS